MTTQDELPPVRRPTGRSTLTGSHLAGAVRARPHEAKWAARVPLPVPETRTATDSFNRSNRLLNGTLTEAGGLTYVDWIGASAAISSNRFTSPGAGVLLDTHSRTHSVEMLHNGDAGNNQFTIRNTSPGDSNDRVSLDASSGTTVDLYKVVGGVLTYVALSVSCVKPCRVKLAAAGDVVTVYRNGVLIYTYNITDPSLRTGTYVGAVAYSGSPTLDDLSVTWLPA